MRSGAVAGIQDMGAAGLTSSSCEMAARANTGIELDLSLVPQREQGMTAYEMLLSESQERMLIVAHSGREREVVEIFSKWDLDAVVIGRVRDTGRMQVIHNGETVADIPVSLLTDEAPKYQRPMAAPSPKSKVQRPTSGSNMGAELGSSDSDKDQRPKAQDQNHNNDLLKLLSTPNIASKHWVYRQYDHMVRTNTAVLPGADAAVVRIKETRRGLAMTLDGNGRYCALKPREGAKLIVAEAARNVVCVGARPLAVTNCLNFASPEKPEVMWSFSEVIDGMAEACKVFNTPVVSGNVSFYNETDGKGILPTPVIGMIGLVEDVRRVVQQGFKQEGDHIALLGTTADDLSISEYANSVAGPSIQEGEAVPRLDLDLEFKVQQVCLEAAEAGLLQSAHDCSDGGIAVALAESCFSSLNRSGIGADVEMTGSLPSATLLFSESPSRIIISFAESAREAIEDIARLKGCPFAILGKVGGARLRIKTVTATVIDSDVEQLENAWRTSLSKKLQAEAMAAGRE
ncbi:MAG: AIR synthase-related protein, partial [Pyrinomonadaceae bacterium]|nr:AIR synthase-related protein [Pyrinomonadaceae bacterium]